MTKPIPDKAEVALEYPDKLYIGTFEQTARFDAHLDEAGISLSLHRMGSEDVRKTVRMHFHFSLFAEILRDLATTVKALPPADIAHREALRTPRRRYTSRSTRIRQEGRRHGEATALDERGCVPQLRVARDQDARRAKSRCDRKNWRSQTVGAGEGNRTLVISLEGCCSTIELHPRTAAHFPKFARLRRARRGTFALAGLPTEAPKRAKVVGEVGLEPTKA